MSQKSLSRFVKAIIILALCCAAVVYLVLLPARGNELFGNAPSGAGMRPVWLTLEALTAIPVLWALVHAWMVARNIGLDRSFSEANAGHLKVVSILAAVDGGYYLLLSLVFFFIVPRDAVTLLAPAVLVMLAAAGSVTAAALSHLVQKAARLQEENDLTI